jgi:hypothetical protein
MSAVFFVQNKWVSNSFFVYSILTELTHSKTFPLQIFQQQNMINTLVIALLMLVCLSQTLAFTPSTLPTTFRPNTRVTRVMSSAPKSDANAHAKAALLGLSTALAPMAAQADTVDEATVIGLGVGLVACVVSLAVGFSIGYGTLNKL